MLDFGFFLSIEYFFFGVFLDGLVICKCCGVGGCEIKVLMCGNIVYIYFLYLFEIIFMIGKKIINIKIIFE